MSENVGPDQPKKIVVVGGGRAGEAILELLAGDDRYHPFVCEIDYTQLRALRDAGFSGEQINGSDARQIDPVLSDAACVICAAPPSVAPILARAALAAGCHYIDMSEQASGITNIVGQGTMDGQCFVPGCGLAPGLVPALVDTMIRDAPPASDITAYVGVLPVQKANRLGYGNLWGIDGLMAEYTKPCQGIENGEITTKPPLEALEDIAVNGESFEAFATAGSLDGLLDYYCGRIRGLAFKTLRYPGHLDYIRFLLDDLNLADRPYMFRNLLLNGLPKIERDRIVISIIDRNPDNPRQLTRLFDAIPVGSGHFRSAVSAVAAQHVCAVADILVLGLAPKQGVLHHSDVTLEILGQSRFGRTLHLPDQPSQDDPESTVNA